MIDKKQSDQLLNFFENMFSFYQDFLAFEQKKYDIILSGDYAKLDEALKREQAFTLKARGMESERTKLLEEAGASGSTFRELIPQIEPSRQEKMQVLYEDISSVVGRIRQTNENSARMLRVKMGHVSKVLSNLENHPELKQIYNEKFKGKLNSGSTFSRKI